MLKPRHGYQRRVTQVPMCDNKFSLKPPKLSLLIAAAIMYRTETLNNVGFGETHSHSPSTSTQSTRQRVISVENIFGILIASSWSQEVGRYGRCGGNGFFFFLLSTLVFAMHVLHNIDVA